MLLEFVVNLWNEDLHWFNGKRTFGGMYMRFSGSVGSMVASSAFMWFCIYLWIPNVSSYIKGFYR